MSSLTPQELIDGLRDQSLFVARLMGGSGEKYDSQTLSHALDWLLGTFLCKRHKKRGGGTDDIVREGVEGYLRRMADSAPGCFKATRSGWYLREGLPRPKNSGTCIAYRLAGTRIRVTLCDTSKENIIHLYETSLSWDKMTWNPKSFQPIVAYLEAWKACGDRLPGLILDGACPVELPEIEL